MQDENNLRMLTVEEAGKEGRVILDLRSPEEFRSSSCPGAVSFPRSDFLKDREGATGRLDRTHSYALMDNSGNGSREICLHLMREGFDLAILSGGWRSYLAGKLGRFLLEEEETRKARLAGIERSIIKKFRKELWCPFTKAVREYHLIEEGDRIACFHTLDHKAVTFGILSVALNLFHFRLQENIRPVGHILALFPLDITDIGVG